MAEILTLFWILHSMWPDELRKEICKITLFLICKIYPFFVFLESLFGVYLVNYPYTQKYYYIYVGECNDFTIFPLT